MQELVDKQLHRRALTVPTSEFPHCCESTLRPFLIMYGSSNSANLTLDQVSAVPYRRPAAAGAVAKCSTADPSGCSLPRACS